MSTTLDSRSLNTNSSTDSFKVSAKVLNELVESSKTISTASSELGSIQLSVNEIRRRAHELRKKTGIEKNHTKAHYLLAGSGLAIEDVDLSLKDLQSTQLLEQTVPNHYVDGEIDTYLKIKKDENILSSIENLLSLAAKDFDGFVNQNLNLDWEQRKEEVRENFGILVKRKPNFDYAKTLAPLNPKLPTWGIRGTGILSGEGTKLNVNENYVVREKFERYAKIIYKFNNARQARQHFPLAQECLNMLRMSGDSQDRQLLESWEILEELKNDSNIVSTAKSYLQKQFFDYVDHLYRKNLNEGLPTNINKIKSFIDFKLKNPNNTWKFRNLTIVNGIPLWALIFYLLRAGLVQEALEVAINNKASFKKVEQSFVTYLKAYASSKDNRLPIEFSTRLHTEYSQHIKSSLDGDPFRLAVYKIIGRCDLTRKNISSVTLSLEDWLWVHFMLIKHDIAVNDPVYERYSLEDFQNVIVSYGSEKFTNHYLKVLVLSGLYELAVQHAYSISEIDAVHMAIGLANQNLLSVYTYCEEERELKNDKELIIVANNARKINFTKILGNYTTSFKFSDPRIAAEYLILINLVKTPQQIRLCHEALTELVLETKEFTILLGKINRDGTRIPGVIEERRPLLFLADEKEFLHTITEQAARRADEDGRIHDSLLLYQLAEEYNIVITIVNNMLSDLLSNTDLDQPLLTIDDTSETSPILIAKKLVSIYMDNLEISKKIHTKNKETCILLLKLTDARKTYSAHQWQNALSQIEELDIIPFSDEVSARKKAQEFSSLNENIIKNIPSMLIMTMSCVHNLIEELRKSDYKSITKDQQVSALKNISRNCMIYAGIIQYKMPRETYSALIKFDIGV